MNFSVTNELFSDPIHLIFSAFLAEFDLANYVVPRAAKFGRTRCGFDQPAEFTQNQAERPRQIINIQPGGNDEVPCVLKKTWAAVNRVSKAAIFPDDLKEPRTHILAQNGIEQAERVTEFIVAGAGANSERELRLLSFFREQM